MLDSPRARQQSRNADAYSGELAGQPLDRALLACLIERSWNAGLQRGSPA